MLEPLDDEQFTDELRRDIKRAIDAHGPLAYVERLAVFSKMATGELLSDNDSSNSSLIDTDSIRAELDRLREQNPNNVIDL